MKSHKGSFVVRFVVVLGTVATLAAMFPTMASAAIIVYWGAWGQCQVGSGSDVQFVYAPVKPSACP